MKKNPVLPEWFTKLIDRYQLNQSWLTINVSDVSQLSELSKDQIAFFMNMVKLMHSDLPESQLADEILSLGPREVEEKVAAIDVVISRSQRVGLQVSTINQQVNLNSTEQVQTKIVHIGVQNNFFSTTQFSNMSSTTLKSDGPFRDCFGLPPAFEDFTGREDSLALLEANAGQSTVISHPKKTVSGTGGIGKTQLAVTFAHSKLKQFRETQGKVGYRTIIWFIAGTDEGVDTQGLMMEQMNRLGQQLGFDTKQLNPDALVKLIFQRLSDEYGPYLVVYDNAQNLRSIKHYLPPASVPVIITTRNNIERDWDQTFKAITLSVFSKAEAHAYIKKVLCRNHPDLYQEDDANALAKALGYFPLALTQALAYITSENIGITEYLGEFSQQKGKYLQEPVPKGDPFQEEKNPLSEAYDPQKATVWAVVQLSLKKVINPDAQQILKACVYLAPEAPIDVKLLGNWCAGMAECREAVSALRRYSLLENVSVAGHVRVHQLVQEIVRLADDDEARGGWLKCVTEIIGKHCETEESALADERRRKALFPHLQAVLEHIEGLKDGQTLFALEIAQLQFHLGNVYNVMDDALQSCRFYELSLKALEHLNDEVMLAKCLSNLGGLVAINPGSADYANAVLKRALSIKERIFGSEDPLIASTLVNLGKTTHELGDIEGAKALYDRALAIQERTLGKDHPDVAPTLGCLGSAVNAQGDTAGAIALYKRALAIRERAFGPEHNKVSGVLEVLGAATVQHGDAVGGKLLIERALAINERIFGSDHHEVASTLMNLGNTALQLGDTAGAKVLYERALVIQERAWGPKHLKVSNTLVNLGNATEILGDAVAAKALYERALTIQESACGSMHLEVAKILENIGNMECRLGDMTSAKVLYKRALVVKEKIFGSNHLEVAKTLGNLGVAALQLGDIEDGKLLMKRALEIQEYHWGSEHFEVARTLVNIALATLQLGDAASGKLMIERALAIQERILGPNHHEVAKTLGNLGAATLKLGDAVGAMARYQRALAIQERAFGAYHPLVAKAMGNLAAATASLGDAVGAKALYVRVLAIKVRLFSQDHPEVAITRAVLADTLISLGQREAALAHYEHCARVFSHHFGEQHPHTRNALAKVHELRVKLRQGPLQSTVSAKSSSVKDILMELILGIKDGEFRSQCQQLLRISRCCFEIEMISEALVLLEFVLEMEASVGGLLLRAQCQLKRCDVSGASETASLCQALLEENNPEVKALLGEIEKSQLQAIQWQASIVELQSLPVFSLRDQVECAITLQRLNRFDEAVRILDTVIASKPTVDILAPAYFNRAICYFRLRRYEEAQKSGEESYRLKEHRNVEGLIKKIILAIEVSPKLNELLDQLRHSSTRTLIL